MLDKESMMEEQTTFSEVIEQHLTFGNKISKDETVQDSTIRIDPGSNFSNASFNILYSE